ncbi:MAG: hypothetical protein ACNYPI_01695 [Arenicellales bacterium WSBS_2016_MAG_OTU3]
MVNEVVQQLYLADTNGYEFYIDWWDSRYHVDPDHEGDPWHYFIFEPCFNIPDGAKPARLQTPESRRFPVHNLIANFLTSPAIYLARLATRFPARSLIAIFLTRLANFLTSPAIYLARLATRFPARSLIAIFLTRLVIFSNKLTMFLTKLTKQLPVGSSIVHTKDNIITPKEVDGDTSRLLPHDRSVPNKVIQKHLHLKPMVIKIVDEFVKTHFPEVTIGLHIRGVGHNVELPLAKDKHSNSVNYERYFQPVNAALLKYPDAKILACSDSQEVIDHIIEVYGERTITYESTRSAFGEMHNPDYSQQNKGLTFSPYKLGLDVVVEAYLLARTNYFVHGSSNVVNFVLSVNDRLDSFYVYADFV